MRLTQENINTGLAALAIVISAFSLWSNVREGRRAQKAEMRLPLYRKIPDVQIKILKEFTARTFTESTRKEVWDLCLDAHTLGLHEMASYLSDIELMMKNAMRDDIFDDYTVKHLPYLVGKIDSLIISDSRSLVK